jgi:DNA-binding transcriptional regulator LsrR (DeoR family)
MARLNVYLPDDLYELANRWRGTLNLSGICATALREELSAAEASRAAVNLSAIFEKPTPLEATLKSTYQLTDVVLCEVELSDPQIREKLGIAAASYLNRWLGDYSVLAVAGGRQIWSVLRNLSPRNLRIDITAIGVEQNDPQALHTHPNTLLTLLWLLYGSRSKAHLVGSTKFKQLWALPKKENASPTYFVLSSCSEFSPQSPFAQLLGQETTGLLLDQRAAADFAYAFFRENGETIETVDFGAKHTSLFESQKLARISARSDSRVIMVAGGIDKGKVISWVLRNRLCNTLITDVNTAKTLMEN